MKFFGFEIRRIKNKLKVNRNYNAASTGRLTSNWLTSSRISDEILRWNLPRIRDRSRDLAQNDDYVKNFFRKLKTNVIGSSGITLQSKAKLNNGVLDKTSNVKIEDAWRRWMSKENASVCGNLPFRAILNLALESVARDGEVLIRKVKGYDNNFSFALQVLEADHLDLSYNKELPDGNKIRLGIEKNLWGKPIAYHILEEHPGSQIIDTMRQKRLRIPAEDIIHLFIKERPTQSRGVPWAHTAIIRLYQLGAYEEAAIVNARVGASRMAFIIDGEETSYDGDGKDEKGNTISEVEPGMLERLPYGSDLKEFDAAYPNGEFPVFVKAMLRGISSGLGCSYNSLANDLEGVNYSSLRSGLLEERDGWKMIQEWFIETCLIDIYRGWLEMAILSGQLSLPYSDIDRFYAPRWQGRRWEWVDPLKDINARIMELRAGLTTRTRICAEKGEDFEEILEELKEEQNLINDAGLSFNLDTWASGPNDTKDGKMEGVNNEQNNQDREAIPLFQHNKRGY